MADEEMGVIIDIGFGKLMFFKEEDEFVICFRTEDADLMDLFYVKVGDNCLKCFTFGDVYSEDPTYNFTITRDEIKEAFNL